MKIRSIFDEFVDGVSNFGQLDRVLKNIQKFHRYVWVVGRFKKKFIF